MNSTRKFILSDETFQGFELNLDLDFYDSTEEICAHMKQNLTGFLENCNLESLLKIAKELHLHIHDIEFGTILISEPHQVFWVCSHCSTPVATETMGEIPIPSAPSVI